MSTLAFRKSFEPRLYYLEIILTIDNYHYPVKALIDTGCAKSAMSKQTFETIKQMAQNFKLSHSSAKIQTCDGTSHTIMGFTTVTISFVNTHFSLTDQQVMVIAQLSDNFIIGSDILGSKYVKKIQTPHIYFTDGTNDFPQLMTQIRYPDLQFKSISPMTIGPNQTIQISQEIVGFKPLVNPIIATPGVPNLKIANLSIENNAIITDLINTTCDKITIPENTNLLDISKSNFNQSMPNDEYMNDDERLSAYNSFREDGVFQPSVTSFIESRSNITEAEIVDIPLNVTDDDFINMFDLNHFNTQEKHKIIKILMGTRDAFSMHKYDIGKTNVVTMDIELIREEQDKVQKYVPIALHVIDQANEILDQMEKYGIIRECHVPTPYCSNILVIPKKDKKAIRLLFDGRLLNYNTKRMPVAIITKAEILAHLVNKTHLSSLDFADAFFHIPLTEYAQNLTAFWTPNHAKKMCFNRAPQGLRNSPMYLKMVLDHIFYDLTKNVLFYADDLLIATNGTLDDHFNFLRLVLKRLVRAGLKLRPQKLLIARETIDFLGMVFYKNTLSIPDLKLKAFKELPIPNTARRLKSALCAFSYYRHFIPNFAHITRELHEKSSSKTKAFEMTDSDIKQFQFIVDSICKNAMTYYPDNNKPFYVQTDASLYCAGGRLFQKNDKDEEMLIAAVSRTFTKTERNYTIYKKEALALLYTLRSMDFFLQFAPKLILLVDAKALTYIRLAKEGAPILLRFSLELSKYEADLIHIPGEQNEISDLLSRQHKDIPQIELEKADNPTISEKDTIKIIDALTIPDNFTLTKTQLFSLLNGPSPIDEKPKTRKAKSKAQPGLKQVKNTPVTLNNRKIKMPRVISAPRKIRVNVLTRAQSKRQVTFSEDRPQIINDSEPTVVNLEIEPTINQTPISQDPLPNLESSLTDQNNPLYIQYNDISSQMQLTNNDSISRKQFSDLQSQDFQIQKAIKSKSADVTIIDKLAYKQVNGHNRLMIPEALVPALVNLHHFTRPGIHKTKSQIMRDILAIYYLPQARLRQLIVNQISNCHICQLFNDDKQNLHILQLPRFKQSRLSWSIDLITDLPTSINGFKILLMAVDDFSNFTLAIPLTNTTSEELIKAIRNHIIGPFGIPKFIRSDEQPGIYNSKEFFNFFSETGIELQATAVASPFSNGRAEATIKIFKHAARKYFYHHNCLNKWDEHAPIIAATINSSINTYGYAPEEIMFGHRLENNYALIDLPHTEAEAHTNEPTLDMFMARAAELREKYDKNKTAKHDKNATFKNQHSQSKQFEVGDLVLHRQLQVSTGTASKYRPLLTGPFVIQATDGVTATCKNMQSSRIIKAHFQNLVSYNYDDATLYPRANFPEGPRCAEMTI